MKEDSMIKPALVGGVVLGVLSALPIVNYFNCICCAWVILGGILAARLYVKESSRAVTLGGGATVGLLTGIIGFLVFLLFSMPLILISSRADGLIQQINQIFEQLPNIPPETRDMLKDLESRDSINMILYALVFFFILVINCVVAMIGGTIGVAIFEKRRPELSPPKPPSVIG